MELDSIYEKAIEWGIQRAKNVGTIALGFHSVIDGLVRVSPEKFNNIMDIEISENSDVLPKSIKTKKDFFKSLTFSFANGSALQLMIDSENVYRWLLKKFGTGTLRLGGTSANMAKTLSNFPFQKILIYAYPLTKELANLFPDSKNLFVVHEDGLSHPQNVHAEEGIRAIHWIFEFSQSQELRMGDNVYVCPRSNRFIASWNPVNSRLEIKEPFKSYVLDHAEEISHFLISGFHIMQDVYQNGETVDDRLLELKKFIREMRKRNSQIKFHIEFASIRRDRVRRTVEEKLFAEFDSLGLNEVELSWIARDLGYDDKSILSLNIEKISEFISKLMKGKLSRIHFHALGFYLLAFDDSIYDVELQKKSLAFAALAAAQRASDGEMIVERLKNMLDVPNSGYKFKEWKHENTHFILFPTKVIKNPKITVGLGDTISSLGFVLG